MLGLSRREAIMKSETRTTGNAETRTGYETDGRGRNERLRTIRKQLRKTRQDPFVLYSVRPASNPNALLLGEVLLQRLGGSLLRLDLAYCRIVGNLKSTVQFRQGGGIAVMSPGS